MPKIVEIPSFYCVGSTLIQPTFQIEEMYGSVSQIPGGSANAPYNTWKIKIYKIFGVDDNSISILCIHESWAIPAHDNPNSALKFTFRMSALTLYKKSYVHRILLCIWFMFTSHGLHFFLLFTCWASYMNSMSILCTQYEIYRI